MHCNMVQQRRVHRAHMDVATLIAHTSYIIHVAHMHARFQTHTQCLLSKFALFGSILCGRIFRDIFDRKGFFARAHQCLQLEQVNFFFFYLCFQFFFTENWSMAMFCFFSFFSFFRVSSLFFELVTVHVSIAPLIYF